MSTGVVSPLIPSQRFVTLAQTGFVPMQSPGVCVITGAGRPIKFDEQEGYGIDGGRLAVIGLKFVHFEVEFRIWLAEHWVKWQLFELLLEPSFPIPGGKALSLGIEHPILKNVGIDKVLVEDPGQWTVSETGLWSRAVKFIKYVRGRDRLLSAKEGPTATTVKTGPPKTAQQIANEALADENANLRATAGNK